MVLGDQAFEALVEDVGVDLGRRDVGVAEHLLQAAQVGAVGQQVAGEGVAQDVGGDLGGVEARLRRQGLEQLRETVAGEVPADSKTGTAVLIFLILLLPHMFFWAGNDCVLKPTP